MAKKAKQSKKSPLDGVFINPVKRQLKQPTLNGMPRIRNAKLDKYAEAVGECRDSINDATREIKDYKAAALKEMLAKRLAFWSHGGVDFIVTLGEPALKVKTHKEGSSETGSNAEDDGYAEDASAVAAEAETPL